MVPCHSCHIYGIWTSRSKEVWGTLLKPSIRVAMHVTRGQLFYREGGFSLCITAVLKFYCKSYWLL